MNRRFAFLYFETLDAALAGSIRWDRDRAAMRGALNNRLIPWDRDQEAMRGPRGSTLPRRAGAVLQRPYPAPLDELRCSLWQRRANAERPRASRDDSRSSHASTRSESALPDSAIRCRAPRLARWQVPDHNGYRDTDAARDSDRHGRSHTPTPSSRD